MLLSSTTRLRHTVSWLSKHPKMICPLQNVSKFAIISLQYVLSVLIETKQHNVAHCTLSMSLLTCNTPSACYFLTQYVLAILFPGCQNTQRWPILCETSLNCHISLRHVVSTLSLSCNVSLLCRFTSLKFHKHVPEVVRFMSLYVAKMLQTRP